MKFHATQTLELGTEWSLSKMAAIREMKGCLISMVSEVGWATGPNNFSLKGVVGRLSTHRQFLY
jgi:hypothetical protein